MPVGACESVLTVCPFCASGCGLYLQRRGEVVHGVMPSEHHPVSLGRLCARGWAAHEASLWGRRVEQPMVRRHGSLQPATWDAALSEAARGLRAVVAAGRPVGVLGSGRATNEENFMAARLARGALGTPHLDACLGGPYRGMLSGLLTSGAALDLTTALADLAAADRILLFEDDLARTHPRVAFSLLRAVHAGARLVTLGPLRTQLSRLAVRHVPLLPGDVPRLVRDLEAAERGVPLAEPAGEAFRCLGEAKHGAVVLALSAPAADLERLARALGTVAAAARDSATCLVLPVPARANTRGAVEMGVAPSLLPGWAALGDQSARRRLRASWECEIVAERGLEAEEMISQVAGLVVLADHPPAAALSGTAAQAALEKLDCLITLDAFWTPTAAASHVVLPIVSPLEADGTFTSLEGRVQRLRGAVSAPGEARPGWRVLNDLGAALGLPAIAATVDDVQAAIAAAVPSYARAIRNGGGVVEMEDIPREAATAPVARSEAPPPTAGAGEPQAFPFRLARWGSFEWGEDPLVSGSPTLRRDYQSLRRRYPGGLLAMSPGDAERLGVREGWRVRIVSRRGSAVTAVRLRRDIEPGVLLAPFAFRDHLETALGGEVEVLARVEVA